MHPRKFLRTLYAAGFIFSFHVALTVYINSSFLATKIPESLVGELYTASAILTLIGLFLVPRFVNQYGSRSVLAVLFSMNIAALIGMVYGNPIIAALCFVLFFTGNTLVYLGLDIMIERWSSIADQGSIRGMYLSLNNIGYMIAPLITGYIADRLGLDIVYGLALLLFVPVLIVVLIKLPSITKTHPAQSNILNLAKKFIQDPHLRKVFLVNFVLQFFYAWMVIYTPLYLHGTLQIPWDRIGILFTVMLSAFVLFEYITGKLADRFHIEKPMMILGLIIMGISTIFIPYVNSTPFVFLVLLFFITRVGASIVEVMTESYFFKHVHHDDVGSIGFFRNTYPFAYIIAPITASLVLGFAEITTLFTLLGVICIATILLVVPLKHH